MILGLFIMAFIATVALTLIANDLYSIVVEIKKIRKKMK